MKCELFREARRGNRGAVGKLLNRHAEYLRSLAARELDQHPEMSLHAGELVERTLRTAHDEFASFTGLTDDDWLEWLKAKLQQSLTEATANHGERLQVALATLPTVQGQVVRLRQIHGWNLARIADHLGLDEVVVAGLLRRGLQHLRGVIAPREARGL